MYFLKYSFIVFEITNRILLPEECPNRIDEHEAVNIYRSAEIVHLSKNNYN